ncbi:MAG TPA: ATP-binding protein, partial [Gemmatimonadaceae bacterium]|nr:ATP-binding protein [Gemmatimonadaceae bacterium]
MTIPTLRTRLTLAVFASLLTGGAAVVLGAQHLEQLQRAQPVLADGAFMRAVWMTMGVVVLVANITGIGVLLLTARVLDHNLTRLCDAVAALGRGDVDAPEMHPVPHGPAFAPLHAAVQSSRAQLGDTIAQLRMDADRNRAIVDTVFASVFAVDGGGRIVRANPAAAQLFDRPIDSLNHVLLSDLIVAESLHMRVDEHGTVTFDGSATEQRFTTRIRVFGRPPFPAEVAIRPLALEGQTAWAVFVHDLSDKQHAEIELRKATAAADKANRTTTAFLARMSHELRTPLNSMIGFTRIVRKSRGSQLSERDRHYLDRVQAGSEDLVELVNDILDLSNVESGTIDLKPEPTDVTAIVRSILSRFDPQVADRPVLLAADLPEEPALANVDPARLRQILTNLIGNAVKFTARGSVRVTLCTSHGTDAATAVIVRDTGIGIPLERQPFIFDLFEQGDDATTHRYGGTGLGLAL